MDRRAHNIRNSYSASRRQRQDRWNENQNNGGIGGRTRNYCPHHRCPCQVASSASDSTGQHVETRQSNNNYMSLSPKNSSDTTNSESEQGSSQLSNLVSTVTLTDSQSSSSGQPDEESLLVKLQWTLLTLPDDVLFLIFTYLQPVEVCRLSRVCRRFQQLASEDSVWIYQAKTTAVVKNISDCRPTPAKELCRVAPNWKLGRFKETLAVKHKHRLMPWVQKNDDGLWYSMDRSIHCFQPYSAGHFQENKDKCLLGLEKDATRFLVKKNKVVSGCRDGSVCCWDVSGTPLFNYKKVHKSDTQCVDFTDSVVISGSRDTTCKILRMEAPPDKDDLLLQTFDVGEKVWSLKISPCESLFAVGLAGFLTEPPVVIWDIESGECVGQLSMNHRHGAGVLDLKFESQHELLTCGYDTFIRLWDLRTQTCVQQWEEPYDSALYCIESDGSNTMVVGTAQYGMVRLWDKRKTDPVQFYYSKNRNSPVYSLAMDYAHLYLALDVGLNVMDFSGTYMNTTVTAAAGCGCSKHLQDMSGRQKRGNRRSFKR